MLLAQEGGELVPRVLLLGDPVADVGPVEAGDELGGVFELEPRDDLPAGGRVRGRCERDARDLRPALVQQVELDVVGPEVVAPLGDAVGLVDREQRDRHPPEQLQETLGQQPLRGHVEQIQLAGQQCPLHPRLLVARQGRVQKGGPHPELPQAHPPGPASAR